MLTENNKAIQSTEDLSSVPSPADLPEDWETGQIVSPDGVSAGLTKQHGYNYLNKQVNDVQTILNTLRKWTIDEIMTFYGYFQQGNVPIYNGEVQYPTFIGYDPAFIELTGDISAVDAGSYTVEFTPKNGYEWPWGDTEPVSGDWAIAKADNVISLDVTDLTIKLDGQESAIKATQSGTGAIIALSSNSNVASVVVTGNTVHVIPKSIGTTNIRIYAQSDNNYSQSNVVIVPVTVEIPIYGASWDGTSTTKWTRTDDAADFADPVPYVAGATAYGSPFDELQPWNGIFEVTRPEGMMVAIPKFYYALTQLDGGGMKIQISQYFFPGASVSPAHMDRGDGKGERNTVYIGRYHCGEDDWKSATGVKPKVSITRATARTAIHELGENVWQADFAMRFTIWLLYIVEFADWNSQEAIGYGCGNGNSVGNMGYTDSMPYHTGTTQSSRETYGLGTQYRNIEGLWDSVIDWVDGCYNNTDGFNIIKNPAQFSDDSGGNVAILPTFIGNGFPSAFDITSSGGFPLFYAKNNSGGGVNTYSCDLWGFQLYSQCVASGGGFHSSPGLGLFYISFFESSGSSDEVGSRLMELP